jgi:hypothetical protein
MMLVFFFETGDSPNPTSIEAGSIALFKIPTIVRYMVQSPAFDPNA